MTTVAVRRGSRTVAATREGLRRVGVELEEDRVRVAAAQARPVRLDPTPTTKTVVAWLEDAAAQQVDLVTFGESFLSGYPVWLELTGGARFDDPTQKQAYAAYLNAAVVMDRPEISAVVEASLWGVTYIPLVAGLLLLAALGLASMPAASLSRVRSPNHSDLKPDVAPIDLPPGDPDHQSDPHPDDVRGTVVSRGLGKSAGFSEFILASTAHVDGRGPGDGGLSTLNNAADVCVAATEREVEVGPARQADG